MEQIKGKVDITMSVAEVTHINSLIERDTALPIRKSVWEYEGKKYTDFKCSKCDSIVKATDGFCHVCGQRLDTDNTEIGGE
jgi:rRNA maturation endonuclease Nob1